MARYRGPRCRRCRQVGETVCDRPEKCALVRRPYRPGQHGQGRVRQSDYLHQLREKQKAKYIYGLLERQFRGYYARAVRQGGVTGERLLRLLEMRLDNVVFRLGFAATRRQARQLVVHGHFLVNGKRVDRPSYQVRPEEVIALRPSSPAETIVREAGGLIAMVPPWLEADHDALRGRILHPPEREEIAIPVHEQLIVEFYSR